MERFIKFDKPQDFPGKAALAAEKQAGRKKGFVTLTIDEPCAFDAPYMSTIWHGDEVVGEVTSSAMGYRTGKCIALGMLRADLLEPGTALKVEIFGARYSATVQPDAPMWDPANERLRA
jgi:dimethylglycine dehydrogenase